MKVLHITIALLSLVPYGISQRFEQNGFHRRRFMGNGGSLNLAGFSDVCQAHDGSEGRCASLKNCPEVLELYNNMPKDRAIEISKDLRWRCQNRVTSDNYPIVCCASPVGAVLPAPTTKATTPSPIITTTKLPEIPKSTLKLFGDTCNGPEERTGFCKALNDCPELFDRLKKNPTNETAALIRSLHVECSSIGTNVCCPGAPAMARGGTSVEGPKTLPAEDDGCGISHQPFTKIIGGVDSQVGAWPWIALIGYDIRSAQPFRCGGTLITARHVLSAAHCLSAEPTFVRLGEFDVTTDTETNHIDIDLEKAVGHPQFSNRDKRNDIAVLYLERNAPLSQLIAPICLPTAVDLRAKSYIGYSPFVAGWGKTESGNTANVLQQLQIHVYETAVCRNIYISRSRYVTAEQFDDTVMCAGSLGGGKDSCQGDSGGPLMTAELYKGVNRFYLIGVVSYGLNCGEVGTPGVYARVQHFLDWIAARVAE